MAAQMSGNVRISRGSEAELLTAVAYVGPVAVAVDINNNAFRVRKLYLSGSQVAIATVIKAHTLSHTHILHIPCAVLLIRCL